MAQTLRDILDYHATIYSKSTMDYITHKITEAEKQKVWQESDEKTEAAIKADKEQAEKRAYKQGWDSAGGELIKNKEEIDEAVLAARIDELNNDYKNSGMKRSFYEARLASLQQASQKGTQ